MENGYVNIKSAPKINLLEDSEALKKKSRKFILSLIPWSFSEVVSWALVVFWVFSIYLYFRQGCMKALGNEQFLNTCVSLTTFLYKLYVHQHNNVNKSNERYQLIIWLGIVLDLQEDVWRHSEINSVLIPVSSTIFLNEVINLWTEHCKQS